MRYLHFSQWTRQAPFTQPLVLDTVTGHTYRIVGRDPYYYSPAAFIVQHRNTLVLATDKLYVWSAPFGSYGYWDLGEHLARMMNAEETGATSTALVAARTALPRTGDFIRRYPYMLRHAGRHAPALAATSSMAALLTAPVRATLAQARSRPQGERQILDFAGAMLSLYMPAPAEMHAYTADGSRMAAVSAWNISGYRYHRFPQNAYYAPAPGRYPTSHLRTMPAEFLAEHMERIHNPTHRARERVTAHRVFENV